ncbi:hypothetical protein JKG47_21000 [Acidithiobacillus sp. MC6.1]|nr:hypothetical protein [Acidithiobacillus sp. MC6.1]
MTTHHVAPRLTHKLHSLVDGSLLRNDQTRHVAACRPQPRLPPGGPCFVVWVPISVSH